MARRKDKSLPEGEPEEEEEGSEDDSGAKAMARPRGRRRAERQAAIEAQRRRKRNKSITLVVLIVVAAIGASLIYYALTQEKEEETGNPIVVMETSYGNIEIELYMDKTPETAGNFEELVKNGFYKGLTFHRIVRNDDFRIIQGGDPNGDGTGGPGYEIDFEEAAGRLKHVRGAVAMARSQDKDSAGSQFYICVNDISQLDGEYAVFGRVVSGMEAVDTINQLQTDSQDRPLITVSITDAYIKGDRPEPPEG